jgi:hypothetical protein
VCVCVCVCVFFQIKKNILENKYYHNSKKKYLNISSINNQDNQASLIVTKKLLDWSCIYLLFFFS